MSEDPTRASARPDVPRYGRVGPVDPREDPATQPAMRPADLSAWDGPTTSNPHGVDMGDDLLRDSERPTVRTPLPDHDAPTVAAPRGGAALAHTRTSGLWTGLILSAIVLILLLVFILQNSTPVQITFLGLSGSLPTGVALLFAAIAGLLLVAIPGGLRILQLRKAARRAARHPD
ncbi:LapA family protein [Pseudonocardia lacus]|uniref:LapA family protein n=1 Tax=Pseudonocardia lacus TaxID=2835865 RepID=UPI0027E25A4C|nr:lipopolysaccharide assembly protein LapA domain-containing protein [Pseudonocardia lacus]